MKAWELLSDESKWTQMAIARTKSGMAVLGDSPKAVCWCLLGAIQQCYSRVTPIHNKLRAATNQISLVMWNDDPERKYSEVYQLLKELDI